MRKSILTRRPRCDCAVALVVGTLLLLYFPEASHAADITRGTSNGFRFVDLSSFAAPGETPARQFSVLPTGRQNFHGVPFQVDSRIAVTGIESARGGEFFPSEVTGIKIGGNVTRLHLLH